MAERPVFIANHSGMTCYTRMTEFTYAGGFSMAQKRRCVQSLHASVQNFYPELRILEVSSCSEDPLGVNLSAFNLPIKMKSGIVTTVECAFQGSKVFGSKGPFTDLLTVDSREAKKDDRIRSSGPITGFEFDGVKYPNEPRTFFYDYLFFTALRQNPDLADRLMKYDAFTDIFFNPERSENCQAAACARYVSLRTAGLLDKAMNDLEFFKKTYDRGYRVNESSTVIQPVEKPVPKKEAVQFHAGDHILHEKFGEGEITGIQGKNTILLEIQFKEVKKKIGRAHV